MFLFIETHVFVSCEFHQGCFRSDGAKASFRNSGVFPLFPFRFWRRRLASRLGCFFPAFAGRGDEKRLGETSRRSYFRGFCSARAPRLGGAGDSFLCTGREKQGRGQKKPRFHRIVCTVACRFFCGLPRFLAAEGVIDEILPTWPAPALCKKGAGRMPPVQDLPLAAARVLLAAWRSSLP